MSDTPTSPTEPAGPTWRERLDEARLRTVFEPTPSGAAPHVVTLERLAETLDAVEVLSAATTSDSSPTAILARAVAMLFREAINTRLYERNLHARFEAGPDRIDEIAAALGTLIDAQRAGK